MEAGTPSPLSDDAREAADLVQALRDHLEWQAELGGVGVPPTDGSRQVGATAERRPAVDSNAIARLESGAPAAASPAPIGSPASGPSTPELRRLRLVELAREISGCQKCPLCTERTQTVFARGNPAADLCFVGEGPGADEDLEGAPFVGRAGQLLDKMIVAMGYSRDDVYVCNIVKCCPPNNRKPEPDEMATCMPYLTEQLALVAPKVIVALGATAVEGLLGVSGGITRMRGQWKLYRGSVPVMPTFDPAYLLRTPAAKREVWDDLKAVLAQLGRPVPTPAR